ncbi:hypothetical protein TWF718_010958 [Orbilia javanica]|uniref:Uncharacterized protein n=1 Tax=Orbilia javanica TaxID=47235 RepID=A0AAN8R9A3_9PEZI
MQSMYQTYHSTSKVPLPTELSSHQLDITDTPSRIPYLNLEYPWRKLPGERSLSSAFPKYKKVPIPFTIFQSLASGQDSHKAEEIYPSSARSSRSTNTARIAPSSILPPSKYHHLHGFIPFANSMHHIYQNLVAYISQLYNTPESIDRSPNSYYP